MQLLQEYATGRSEAAFTALVSRHINLVYSAAMRSVNNPHQAEDITQSVFVILARKSRALRSGTVLSGWLYQTARLTAANFVRTEMRRQHREQQAVIESTMNDTDPEAWTRVGPLLDEAMSQLNEKDRNAIVLRFFEGKALKEVGDALGASEDAAKMRVNRALDKLRDFFHHRGITMPVVRAGGGDCGKLDSSRPGGLGGVGGDGRHSRIGPDRLNFRNHERNHAYHRFGKNQPGHRRGRRRHHRAAMAADFHPKTDCQTASGASGATGANQPGRAGRD